MQRAVGPQDEPVIQGNRKGVSRSGCVAVIAATGNRPGQGLEGCACATTDMTMSTSAPAMPNQPVWCPALAAGERFDTKGI